IAPPQIKETQLPHRTAPIGQIQRDSLNLICWPRGRGIFRDAQESNRRRRRAREHIMGVIEDILCGALDHFGAGHTLGMGRAICRVPGLCRIMGQTMPVPPEPAGSRRDQGLDTRQGQRHRRSSL
ncbi:MAG: hypothetical protein ACR2KT_16790, partial [Methylocella sp.]